MLYERLPGVGKVTILSTLFGHVNGGTSAGLPQPAVCSRLVPA